MNKKKIGIMALVVLLLLFTGVLRQGLSDNELINAAGSLLVFTIYIGMLAAWSLSISRRMVHSHIWGYLLGISSLMLFWIFVRTLKDRPFDLIDPAARFLWYCYYIPMILIPLLSFFSSLCLGMPESWRPRRSYYLLFIPAILLIFGILTNDLHQLAFAFSPGYENWDSLYEYRALYFITVLWMIGISLATVGVFFHKSHIPHTKTRVWLPLAMIGAGAVYCGLYIIDSSVTSFGFIEMTAMYCLLEAGILESCIQTGLLPSNTKYRTFFIASPLNAQISDADGTVCYSSQMSEPVVGEQFKQLKEAGILHPDPNTELHALPIRGGYVTWRKDVSQLMRLIEERRDAGIELQGEVDLLKAELDAKSRRLRVDEQNRLYRLTIRQTMPQLIKIKRYLAAAAFSSELKKQELLQEMNVLGAYIKRRSNLILVAEGQGCVTVDDLTRCFTESLETLEAGGVRCTLTMQIVGEVYPAHAVLYYDLFEEMIEAGFSSLRTAQVTLSDNKTDKVLSIKIASGAEPRCFPSALWREEEVVALGGRILCQRDDNQVYHIALHLPKGGGN